MTPNWIDCPRGVYCRIWPQVNRSGRDKVGGRYLCLKATGLIKPNHQSSGFRPSIPNLWRRFDKSQILINFPLRSVYYWVRDIPRANVRSVLVRLRLMSEEIVCGLREGNNFPTLSCLEDKPLNQFSAMCTCIWKATLKQCKQFKSVPVLHAMHTYHCTSTLQQ